MPVPFSEPAQLKRGNAPAKGRCTILVVSLCLRFREFRLLLRRGFPLVAPFPLGGRHSVGGLTRLILFQGNASFRPGFAVPIAQAIAPAPGEAHQTDILNFRSTPMSSNQRSKRR